MAERLTRELEQHIECYEESIRDGDCPAITRIKELEQELSRLRACVVLTPEQAGQVRTILIRVRDHLVRRRESERACDIAEALTILSTPQPPGKEQG